MSSEGSGSTWSLPRYQLNDEIISAVASSGSTVGRSSIVGMSDENWENILRRQEIRRKAEAARVYSLNYTYGRRARQRAADGKRNLAQNALLSVFGSLVPACFTLLSGDNLLNGASPGYIKAVTCVGLGLVTGFTYLGLASKKRAMAAVRVVASMAMAAVSIALVNTVSENVYIKSTCGIIGTVATVATMAIDW